MKGTAMKPSPSTAEVERHPLWQEVRQNMDGMPTVAKLNRCVQWLHAAVDISPLQREIQVRNYLNELANGGFITPIQNKRQNVEILCRTVTIKR
jgi:hypothetical protein